MATPYTPQVTPTNATTPGAPSPSMGTPTPQTQITTTIANAGAWTPSAGATAAGGLGGSGLAPSTGLSLPSNETFRPVQPQAQPQAQPQPTYQIQPYGTPQPLANQTQAQAQPNTGTQPQPNQTTTSAQPGQPSMTVAQPGTGTQPNQNVQQQLDQVKQQISQMAQATPQDFQNMTPEQLTQSVQTSADGLQQTFTGISDLVQAVINMPTPDIAGTLQQYLTNINGFLDQFVQQAQSAYDNGMNDPGLIAALNMIRDQASTQKQSLDEELNARGMSQSGVWINAMNNFDKAELGQENQLIGAHLSELTKTLQEAMQSVLNQRVAVLSQFAGIQSEAELQAAQMGLQQLTTALQGMTQLAGLQQQDLDSQRDFQLGQDQLTEDRRQFDQQYTLEKQKLEEDVRQFNQTYQLEQAKLAEMIRSNKSQEAIAQQQVAVQRAAAAASRAQNQLSMSDQLNHEKWVTAKVSDLQAQLASGKITPYQFRSQMSTYQAMVDARTPAEQAQWNNLVKSVPTASPTSSAHGATAAASGYTPTSGSNPSWGGSMGGPTANSGNWLTWGK